MSDITSKVKTKKPILSDFSEPVDEVCDLFDGVRVTSPSSSENSFKKDRNDSGSSFTGITREKNSGNSTDSGHGSTTEAEEGIIYAYHFLVPSHLCGVLIGAKGQNVKQLREATKCEVSLSPSVFEEKPQTNKKFNTDPQICIIEGTRSGIERCLELIQEKLPAHQHPDLSLKQINEPSPADLLQTQARAGLLVTLPPGQMSGAVITAIVSTAHIFIQLPENPTFAHLERLERYMFNVYEKSHRTPKVPREAVEPGLVCVTKNQDKYYRLQVIAVEDESCEVKFLDYGGYDNVEVSELFQIRQDFMNLPFQAVECFLSNVIPPAESPDWSFESIVHLEQITNGKNITCREIGVSEDSVPIVQLYATSYNESSDQLETKFINKELVDRGFAQWIEHSTVL